MPKHAMRYLVVAAVCFIVPGSLWAFGFPPKMTQYSPGGSIGGDFNGDGKLDLLSISKCSPEPCSSFAISVSLGSGNGRFQRAIVSTMVDVGFQLEDIAVGDFNNDHKLDIALTSLAFSQSLSSDVAVVLGKGDGTFGAAAILPVASTFFPGLLVGDVNGDHNLDLVMLAEQLQLKVFLGKGDGTFQVLSDAPGTYGERVLADVNHDGKLDLIGDSLQLGNGDGTFQIPQPISGISGNVVVADFDADGNLDVAEQSYNGESPSYSSQNGVNLYFGNGDGTFKPPVFHWIGGTGQSGFTSMSAGDFNGDGKTDLLVGRGGQFDIVLNRGAGKLAPAVGYLAIGGIGILADLNGDHRTDLIFSRSTAPDLASAIPVLAGPGGTFPLSRSYSLPGGNYAMNILAGDLNADGRLDLIELNWQSVTWRGGHLNRLLGNGDGSFKVLPDLLTGGIDSSGAALSDMNHDGKLDVVVVGGGVVNVRLGLGDGNFQGPLATSIHYPTTATVGDFNGDGIPDVALNGSARAILLGNGDGTFRNVFTLPAQFESLVVGDFNGDGKQDLGATFLGGVGVLLGNGDGTFQPVSPLRSGQTQKLLAGDFNLDGKLDLAAVGKNAGGNTVVSVYLGNGDGTLRPTQNTFVHGGVDPAGLVAADFNQDGKVDMVVSLSSADVALLLGDGSGRFQQPTFYYGGTGPVVAGDFDGNGTQDLAVVTSERTVAILLNK
jgi:hypothetical protein